METWEWGQIKSDGYQSEFQDGVLRVDADAGSPFARQRFTDVYKIFQGTFILDRATKIEFESWFKYNLKQGTIPFLYYDCEFQAYRTCRFLEKPTINTLSNRFSVGCRLAFDSTIFYSDRYLTVNNGEYLTVGDDDARLLITKKLRA